MSSARVVIGPEDLKAGVARLAAEISAEHEDGVVLIAVLKGSVLFLADLVRSMSIAPEIDFLAISSYAPDSGRVRMVKDLEVDIQGRDVILIEDLIDTGLTVTYIMSQLAERKPRRLQLCALLDRSVRRIVPTHLDYRGFEVPDEFLIGYGLDFAERYRNLDLVIAVDPDDLVNRPDATVEDLMTG